jgi:hypothetical protein
MQRILQVQEHRHRAAERDCNRRLHRTPGTRRCVHEERRDFRRLARVALSRARFHEVADDEEQGDGSDAGGDDPPPCSSASQPQSVPNAAISGNVRMPPTCDSARSRCSPTRRPSSSEIAIWLNRLAATRILRRRLAATEYQSTLRVAYMTTPRIRNRPIEPISNSVVLVDEQHVQVSIEHRDHTADRHRAANRPSTIIP